MQEAQNFPSSNSNQSPSANALGSFHQKLTELEQILQNLMQLYEFGPSIDPELLQYYSPENDSSFQTDFNELQVCLYGIDQLKKYSNPEDLYFGLFCFMFGMTNGLVTYSKEAVEKLEEVLKYLEVTAEINAEGKEQYELANGPDQYNTLLVELNKIVKRKFDVKNIDDKNIKALWYFYWHSFRHLVILTYDKHRVTDSIKNLRSSLHEIDKDEKLEPIHFLKELISSIISLLEENEKMFRLQASYDEQASQSEPKVRWGSIEEFKEPFWDNYANNCASKLSSKNREPESVLKKGRSSKASFLGRDRFSNPSPSSDFKRKPHCSQNLPTAGLSSSSPSTFGDEIFEKELMKSIYKPESVPKQARPSSDEDSLPKLVDWRTPPGKDVVDIESLIDLGIFPEIESYDPEREEKKEARDSPEREERKEEKPSYRPGF